MALPACAGLTSQAGHGLTASAQKARLQRAVQAHGRVVHAVMPATAVTDDREKERLFQGFVEWQGAQESNR